MDLITITTESGFTCEIDKTVLDDMRLLELIADMQDDAMILPKFLTAFFGAEQKARLYDHVAVEDGRVPIEALQDEIAEIMEKIGEDGKK